MDRVAKTPTATGSGLNSHRESKLNRNLIALFLLGAVTACAHADWKLVATGGPDVRYESGICYDSSRGVTVMFGGSNFGGLLNDTWEWNGTQWTQTATTGPVPGPRSMAYFAYDSDRKVTLMYGGYGSGINGAMNAETWEYIGTKWTQMNVQGPSGRQGGGMAYDPIHHVMVLFGGSVARDGSGIVNQTWTWNGTQWTLASTTGPSARYNFSMAYDSMRQRVVLFGGSDANQNELGDTWEWNGAQWIQTSDQDILPRAEFGIVYDSGMNRTVMFGGLIGSESGPTLAGMETWDGNTWRSVQTQQSGVPAMQNPGLSYDSKRQLRLCEHHLGVGTRARPANPTPALSRWRETRGWNRRPHRTCRGRRHGCQFLLHEGIRDGHLLHSNSCRSESGDVHLSGAEVFISGIYRSGHGNRQQCQCRWNSPNYRLV